MPRCRGGPFRYQKMTIGHVMEQKSQTDRGTQCELKTNFADEPLDPAAPASTGRHAISGSTGDTTIVTCEGEDSQPTNHVWGAPQPEWVCRAGSGSDDHRKHSDETGVGEQTHVSIELTLPFGVLPGTKETSHVAGEQQQHNLTCHTNMTVLTSENDHSSTSDTSHGQRLNISGGAPEQPAAEVECDHAPPAPRQAAPGSGPQRRRFIASVAPQLEELAAYRGHLP